MKIVRHPDVLEELINLSYRIALDNMEAANRFLDACEEAFEQLARTPLIGVARQFRRPVLRNVRMWRVKGFEKHLIFYKPQPTTSEASSPAFRNCHSAEQSTNKN